MLNADEHCTQLVESGFAVKLLALLERNPIDMGRCVTHHAVLSALRNLAIPGSFQLLSTLFHLANFYTVSLTPSVPAVPDCCCSKGSVPHWSNLQFLIFHIRALWRSVVSARAPVCEKLKWLEEKDDLRTWDGR